MSFLKQIINERKERKEKTAFVTRVCEQYGYPENVISEIYDEAFSETGSKVVAKARVFSKIFEKESI